MAEAAPTETARPAVAARARRIGILAVQGAVREHADAVRAIGAEPVMVRLPADLEGLDALILPGGESTTTRRLIDRYGLRGPIMAMAEDDGRYLVTYPGEWLGLSFNLPPTTGRQRTLFLYSKGYYVEWVRPEWIRERADVRGFDITEPDVIRNRLAELWSAKKDTFESKFFQWKFPTADPEKSW